MVQGKVPNKLRTQAHHAISVKRLGNMKPTSCHNQDGKSRGPDMNKEVKTSRTSFKLSDIRTCKSFPGKPPPLKYPQAVVGTSQKRPVIRPGDRSPNYMKATSSSEARKEIGSQVSSFGAQNGSGINNLGKRSSCNSSQLTFASSSKPTKTLTRLSGLKLARTLTKTPSFKPLRGTSKKVATVALCADTKTKNATCSSTLKDSKFPAYLMLNPGGTEAEGTSVMKVCPYTYCSLNGHHHTLLPPLKCFLGARRRTLKVQKSMKLWGLHPRRLRTTSGGGKEEIDCGSFDSSDEERPHTEAAMVELVPGLLAVGEEFFTEIYAKSTEDVTRAKETSSGKNVTGLGATDFSVEPNVKISKSLGRDEEAEADKEEDGLAVEGFSDVMQEREIVFEDEFKQSNITVSVDMNIPEEKKKAEHEENGGADHPTILPQEVTTGSFSLWSDIKGKGHTSMEDEDCIREEADSLHSIDDHVSSCTVGDQSEIKMFDLHGKHEIMTSDDISSNCTDEILAVVVMRELFEEKTASSDKQYQNEGNSETDCLEFESWTGDSTYDQSSFNENEVKELAAAEENSKEDESSSASGGKPIIIPMATEIVLEDKVGETDEGYGKEQEPEDTTSEHTAALCISSIKDEVQEKPDGVTEDGNPRRESATESLTAELDHCPHDKHQESTNEITRLEIPAFVYPDEQSDWGLRGVSFPENNTGGGETIEVEDCTRLEIEGTILAANNGTRLRGLEGTFSHINRRHDQEVPSTCNNRKWRMGNKKPMVDLENERKFNPRDPNFLPVVPGQEAEKVDLRHQMVDDRKNAEEWMLDYALQQTVTKLGVARKRKVALLVEAFETVLPAPKFEPRIRHTTTAFAVTRSIQACS